MENKLTKSDLQAIRTIVRGEIGKARASKALKYTGILVTLVGICAALYYIMLFIDGLSSKKETAAVTVPEESIENDIPEDAEIQ